MKRSQPESTSTDSSNSLFGAESNALSEEAISGETGKPDVPVKPTSRKRAAKKTSKEEDTPKTVEDNVVEEQLVGELFETSPLFATTDSTFFDAADAENKTVLNEPAKEKQTSDEPENEEKVESSNMPTLSSSSVQDNDSPVEANSESLNPEANDKEDVLPIDDAQMSPVSGGLQGDLIRVEKESVGPVWQNKKPSGYQVVARRYRPQAFEELIGQETVARALSNAIATDRIGHAYLFTGARGVGKTSCARIFAKALNCVEGPTTHPCLQCDSCIGIASGEDVDVLEIDGASNRGVDEIRQLRQNATIAPSRSLYKIYIIDEVHMLTREAFNALLKILEEPPARVKFIFCTTEPNKIPITILSRCQRFDFNSINGDSIASRLAQIVAQEGAKVEDGVFEILSRRANGSMRDAQSLLEQLLSFAPDYISVDAVHRMLGTVDDGKIFKILDATVNGDVGRVFETLGDAANQGVDFGALVEQTLGAYRDLMIVASGCGVKEIAYTPAARFEELQKIAHEFGIRRILASLQILDQTIQRMRFSAQARILAEIAFARLCKLDAFQAIETLIAQLKSGAAIQATTFSSASPQRSDDLDAQKKKLPELVSTPETQLPPKPIQDEAQTSNSQGARAKRNIFVEMSQEKLEELWLEATNVGVILPGQASAFSRVQYEEPNNLSVAFSTSNSKARDYCESERDKICARLAETLGNDLTLRIVVDPNAQPRTADADRARKVESATSVENSSKTGAQAVRGVKRPSYRELYIQVEDSAVARQIKELFEAELADVKLPAEPNKNKTF